MNENTDVTVDKRKSSVMYGAQAPLRAHQNA